MPTTKRKVRLTAEIRGTTMKIYVASSWRNNYQPAVVELLRAAGYEVYDFRHPADGNDGFHWSEIDPAWKGWTPERFRECLEHPVARKGFAYDMEALMACDACVLVMPCGRSAHLELGWAVGAGKKTCVLLEDGEPELMYRMVDKLALDGGEVVDWLRTDPEEEWADEDIHGPEDATY